MRIWQIVMTVYISQDALQRPMAVWVCECWFQYVTLRGLNDRAGGSSSLSFQFAFWDFCFFLASRARRNSSKVLRGSMTKANATAAVPSPSCREKHRKVAQRKAQQPMKAVRIYNGISTKFRNCKEETRWDGSGRDGNEQERYLKIDCHISESKCLKCSLNHTDWLNVICNQLEIKKLLSNKNYQSWFTKSIINMNHTVDWRHLTFEPLTTGIHIRSNIF